MTGVRADRRRNDELILRAAAGLLRTDVSATVQAIADAAGLARPTVYRRYPDRDALITRLRAQIEAELAMALADLPPWSEGPSTLTALVTSLVGVAVSYPLALLRYAPVPGSPAAIDKRIADILADGQSAGVVRRDVPAATLNAAIFGVLAAVVDLAPAQAPDTVLALLLPGITATRGQR